MITCDKTIQPVARCDDILRSLGIKLAVVIHIAFLSKMLDKV